jgi:hypothetical protein
MPAQEARARRTPGRHLHWRIVRRRRLLLRAVIAISVLAFVVLSVL